MARYEITSPDGKRFEITAPDDATEDQVMAYAHQNFDKASASEKTSDTKEPNPTRTPPTKKKTALEDFGENYLPLPVAADLAKSIGSQTLSYIGAGLKGAGDVVTGQGMDKASQNVQRILKEGSGIIPRAREPETKGGRAVVNALNVIPNMVGGAFAAPWEVAGRMNEAKPLPGNAPNFLPRNESEGNAIADIIKQGVIPAAITVASGAEALSGERLPLKKTGIQKAAADAQESGYVIPPSQARPNLLNKFIEGYGGKIKTHQEASLKNQEVTNNLVKDALGLDKEDPVSKEGLSDLRKQAGQVYERVKNSGMTMIKPTQEYRKSVIDMRDDYIKGVKDFPEINRSREIENLIDGLMKTNVSTEGVIETVKTLRHDAKANLLNRENPEKLRLGLMQRRAADALDGWMEQGINWASQHNPNLKGLTKEYKDARQLIAKSYDVEAALNDVTGNVDARYLGKLLKKGKPLTDQLRTIAEFGQAFPKASQLPDKMGSIPNVSPLDYFGHAISKGASSIVGRPIARNILLSEPYQNTLGSASIPTYSETNALTNALSSGAIPIGAMNANPGQQQQPSSNMILNALGRLKVGPQHAENELRNMMLKGNQNEQ